MRTIKQQRDSLHMSLAANRLFEQGMTLDQVNEYLATTPIEEMIKANVEHLERKHNTYEEE